MKIMVRNIIFALMSVLLMIPMSTVNVNAEGMNTTLTTNTVTPIQGQSTTNNTSTVSSFDYTPDQELPSVSIDKASNWAERKGQDVVGFLQVAIQPFSVIVFIGCAFITLFGSFGHGGLVSKGIIGMGIAVVIYTGVLFAPELLQFFSRWLAS